MTVLIVAEEDDHAGVDVGQAVSDLGLDHVRLSVADFPQRLTVSAQIGIRDGPPWRLGSKQDSWTGVIEGDDSIVEIADIVGVYYRATAAFDLPEGMSGPEHRFAYLQALHGFGGMLESLPVSWVNSPMAVARAEYKPLQLVAATHCGFDVPATLLTNNAAAVRSFVARRESSDSQSANSEAIVVKPLVGSHVQEGAGYTAAWCRKVPDLAGEALLNVDVTMHQFQRWIEPQYAVRLTAVGEEVFPVAIHAHSAAARVDWRSDYDRLTYERIRAPARVHRSVRCYLGRLGLSYGAFDFIVDEEDRWWFLECNPAGQWGWIAEEADLPVAHALARVLTSAPRTDRVQS